MSNEPAAEAAPEAPPTPDLGDGGNPPPKSEIVEMAEAMAKVDAVNEAEANARLEEIIGPQDAPADAPPPAGDEEQAAKPDDAPAEAAAEEKPPEEAKPAVDPDDTPENISQGYHRLRREKRKMRAEREQLAEQMRQAEASKPLLGIAEQLRQGNTREGFAQFARLVGKDPERLFLDMTAAQLDELPADGEKPGFDPEKFKAEWRAEQEQKEAQAQQARTDQYLQRNVAELTSIGKQPALQKKFLWLGTMGEHKLANEMAQAVGWAHENRRGDLLSDPVTYAGELNTIVRNELKHTITTAMAVDRPALEALLSECGYGIPTKPGATAATPSAKQADASKRTTISDSDTSTGGATAAGDQSDEDTVALMARALEKFG